MPSVGAAMTDALDSFISDRKIEPQIAIKMLAHFDRVVAEVLNEKVKARVSFKVLQTRKPPLRISPGCD